jgi:hypothetical protein
VIEKNSMAREMPPKKKKEAAASSSTPAVAPGDDETFQAMTIEEFNTKEAKKDGAKKSNSAAKEKPNK